jgi:perosamine synthetase
MIPYSTQDVNDSDRKAVDKVLRSRFLTQGPAIDNFENSVAKSSNAKYAVAFTSGTAALHAAYFAAGIGKGDEVIIPALTFAATANAALYLEARPVFADIDLTTGLVNPKDVEKKITKKTKAIVAVDYSGRPAPYKALRTLAKKHNLVLIDDGAHSLGATYEKKPIGTQADMTMFSFHPVKSITTGEGGVIVTNNEKYAKSMRQFRSHGITRDKADLVRVDEGPWYQEMQSLGYNYRMTDMQAALGVNQLKRLGSFVKKRQALARRYEKILAKVPGLIVPPAERANETSAWHLYPVRIADVINRRAIFESLRELGIGVQVHYLPVYRHPYYESLGYKKGLCPNAELFYAGEISIPLFPGLSKSDQDFVVTSLKKSLAAYE